MVSGVPWFIDNRQLRTAVWLMGESIARPIIERLDRLMALVSIDDTVLQGIATSVAGVDTNLQTIATQVQALVTAGTLQPDDAAVQAIQGSLSDIGTQLGTINTALTPASTTPPVTSAPTAPSDPSAPPVDPTAGGTTAAPSS